MPAHFPIITGSGRGPAHTCTRQLLIKALSTGLSFSLLLSCIMMWVNQFLSLEPLPLKIVSSRSLSATYVPLCITAASASLLVLHSAFAYVSRDNRYQELEEGSDLPRSTLSIVYETLRSYCYFALLLCSLNSIMEGSCNLDSSERLRLMSDCIIYVGDIGL